MTTPQPMENVKYKVVELGTSGWCVNDPKQDVGLDREQARVRLNFYMNEGISPDRLRAQIDK
jgi:hypothetical protein|tara:strand:- start:622 stop:807 length:186 start_codon:yes stop_codon:yes gene_type:complete